MKNTGHNLVIRVDLGASAKDAEVITFDNIAQHIDPISRLRKRCNNFTESICART